MRRLLPFVLCLLALLPLAAHAADLAVTVTGIKTQSGDVRVVIIQDPDTQARQLFSRNLSAANAKDGVLVTHFLGVAPGTYGIIAIHDQHEIHSFEKAFTGQVSEPESNSGKVRVTVADPATAITLALP